MFKNYLGKYENELLESVIPFWENHCIDKEFGGYFTSLDRDGSVYDSTKYMWMQWRIVYMFGELYNSEYSRGEWLGIAQYGFDFLRKNGRDKDGRYYFAINRQGKPAIAPYNIYSECFAAMGGAAMYSCTKTELYKEAALDAMNNYIKRIDNPKGQWDKSLPGKQRYQALGHYMMLANLGLTMKDFLGTDEYDHDIESAIEIVLSKFWNESLGVMFENILPDGGFDLDSCDGRMLNPGHVLEAMWFLLKYFDDYSRDEAKIEKVAMIIKKTLEFGWDKTHGGIYYFMDALHKPHLELQWDMKLWWVHCEAILACLYAYKLTGDQEFYDWFEKIHAWTWAHFPDSEYGEWYGYLNRQGEPTHALKGGKWKTFFHLPRCLLYATRLMKQMEK
ncbi:MAG: AGE family epimerase/isomerase [Victivallaceae bacterium]